MTYRELNQEAMRRIGWTEAQVKMASDFADSETGFPDGLNKELEMTVEEQEEIIAHLIGRYHAIQSALQNLTQEEKEKFMAGLLEKNKERARNN